MRKLPPFLLSLILLLLFPTTLLAQEPAEERVTDPEAVTRAMYDALSAKDVETALSYVSEDAVLVILPGTDRVFVGKEAIREWWTFLASDNASFEFTALAVQGEKATWAARGTGDTFVNLDIPFVEFEGVGIVRNGLMQGNIWTFTESSLAWIEAATILSLNKEVVQTYMAAWDAGDVEALDEIFANDFVNHSLPLPPDREGMMQAAADEHIGFPNNTWTIEQIVAEGDLVAVHLRFEGVHEGEFLGVPPTEAEVTFTGTLIFRVQDGQITDRWGDADMVSFLTPLGFELVPPAPSQ